MKRLVLFKPCGIDGWYETLYCDKPSFVLAEFIRLPDDPVTEIVVNHMLFMEKLEMGLERQFTSTATAVK